MSTPRRPLRLLLDTALVAGFVLALALPAIDLVARPASVRSVLRENRPPAAYPGPVKDLFALSKFPGLYERWFDDRFGLRDVLLRGGQWLRVFVFGGDPSPTLVTGKDGWLFFTGDDSLPVQRGLAPLDPGALEKWRAAIEARRDWLRARGIEYVFAIAPNKQSAYPELVGDVHNQVGPTRLDQLAALMQAHSDVRFLDLRAALLAERAHDAGGDFTYHPLGTHWTSRGAWAGWNAVVTSLADAFPALRTVAREDCQRRELSARAGDSMADQTYIGDLVHQRTFAFEPASSPATLVLGERNEVIGSTQADATLPTAMIVHDSFGPFVMPFAALGFSRMEGHWQHSFPKELILLSKPNLVVQMYTERMLVWGVGDMAPDVDPLDEAAFARLEPLWGPLDLVSGALPPTEGGISVAHDAAGWIVQQTADNGTFTLPAVEVPGGADLAMRFEVDAPAPGFLTVFYQLTNDRRFARVRAALVPLEAGHNDARFRLRKSDVWGPLKVRLGARGQYVIRAIEARAAR